MIKSSVLEFHETFQPETTYIAKLLRLASENYVGTKFDISECTGIPTGKQKGKVVPHIRYASCMGLINYSTANGVYSLQLTPLGEEVFVQDPYLHEDLTAWLCHYGMTKRGSSAPQWEYIAHSAHPGFGEKVSQDRLFSLASTWCDVSTANMLKKVFSVVKTSYTEGCFEHLNYLEWDTSITFFEHQENTDYELKEELGFNKIFGLNEDECNYVIDSLADEGIIMVNRQLYPATIIRTSNLTSVISRLYSRLL